MEIPKTTVAEPYIEFRFDSKGKMTLSATSSWWGGKNSGFVSSDGTEGNSSEPKNLDAYIIAYKKKKIKDLEKEIDTLQKKLQKFKEIYK